MHNSERFLVLAIDEIQEAPIDGLRTLVRFIHDSAGSDHPALFLGAGLPNTPQHLHEVRTYTERWTYFRLGLLNEDDARKAITIPLDERGISIAPKALQRLLEESAGYPFFIQEFASAAWLRHHGTRITENDVTASVPGVRKSLETTFYDAHFRKLTPPRMRLRPCHGRPWAW